MSYCTQCGKENDAFSKFCSNCGAKLEQPEDQSVKTQDWFSEEKEPVYEKITEAEEEKPAPISYQEEIKINPYEGEEQSVNNTSTNYNTYYDGQSTGYYAADQKETKQGGGNIGFAIASMICGILSIVCCCFTLFSAVLAVAAIVLGSVTLCSKFDGKGMAIAGIITGGIGVLLIIVTMVMYGSGLYQEFADELLYDLY